MKVATSQTSKSAFTLIELLVYMAIMGFIIVVAGRAFSDSTSMRVRSQSMLKSSEEIGKLATLINEDISQMGLKESGEATADHGYKFGLANNVVYWDMDKGDYSSYRLIRKELTKPDSLIFRKAVFDENGEYVAVHEISWYVREDSLFRKCTPRGVSKSIADNDCSNKEVLIATNIKNFKLTPYKSAEGDTLFQEQFCLYPRPLSGDNIKTVEPPPDCSSGIKTEVSGFEKNATVDEKYRYEFYLAKKEPSSSWTGCEEFELKRNHIYIIEFKMPFSGGKQDISPEQREKYYNSTQFQHGKDHLSIGFRTNTGEGVGISDILFYPPQETPQHPSETETRHLEFPVKADAKACVAITFAFWSPTAWDGIYEFKDFEVLRKADQSLQLPVDPNYGIGDDDSEQKRDEKKHVKAFELLLEIDHRGEKSGTFSQKERGIIIATPNNGTVVDTE